ncbi:hypothetical protein D9M68_915280 [compost metagenome]
MRTADRATLLRQDVDLIDILASGDIGELEYRDCRQVHKLKTRYEDKSDALHAEFPYGLKGCIYDI